MISYAKLSSNNLYSLQSDHSVQIGSTDYGNVVKTGPYGNESSNVKIAYIVGVHPLESNAHNALIESIQTHDESLKYCYYIYHVNVTKDAADYTKGRYNGQILARQFIVPDAVGEHFNLAIDVHSNVGNWAENTFIFSPLNNSTSQYIGMNITNHLSWLTYYVPPNPTSPEYLTVPLNNMGVPAVIYETYSNNSYQTMLSQANEFTATVDNLRLT
jgi:hypothetical protein